MTETRKTRVTSSYAACRRRERTKRRYGSFGGGDEWRERGRDQCGITACGHRMANRKWKETKQLPGTAGPGNMLGSCLVSFHFLRAILCPQAVQLVKLHYNAHVQLWTCSSSFHACIWHWESDGFVFWNSTRGSVNTVHTG